MATTDKGPIFGARHVQILHYFLLTAISFATRVNLSITIIAMTTKYSSNPDVPVYDWDNKSVILSSFFWAYIVLQIGAAPIGRKYGTKRILMITTFIDSTAYIFVPIMAEKFGAYGVMACRIVEGLVQGFVFPSIHNMLGQWAPVNDRSLFGTISYAGVKVGIILSTPLTGYLCSSWIGWPVTFYLYGLCGYAWIISFYFFGADSPALHKTITTAEQKFIESSLGITEEVKDMKTPWKAMLTSVPAWAIIVANIGSSWTSSTAVTQFSIYMDKVIKMNIRSNGLLYAAPYVATLVTSFAVGVLSDYIIKHYKVSVGLCRKVFSFIAFFFSSVFIIILGYLPAKASAAAVVILVIAEAFFSVKVVGFLINHLDLSPNHCGVLMGIVNCLGSLSNIVAPLVVQFIVKDETNQYEWRIIFFIMAAVNLASAIFYVIFGSGEVQPWNYSYKEKSKSETQNESERKST